MVLSTTTGSDGKTYEMALIDHARNCQLGGSFQQSALLAPWIIIGTVSGNESVPPGNGGLMVSSAR